jgi:hypothetical protein
MRTHSVSILIILLLVLVGILAHSAITAPPAFRPAPAFVREAFVGAEPRDPLSPSGPAPRKVNSGEPYTLLDMPTTDQAVPHYGENALSCYAKDYMRSRELVGNYKQETNNYMPSYPDSCSSGRGEFVLGFYKKK